MGLPFRVGLKLHSTNVEVIPQAAALWRQGIFQYIELYTIPGTYANTIASWKDCGIPFVVHAPHSLHGINLALKAQWEPNLRHFREAQMFADALLVDHIIVHGGHTGSIEETIRQARKLNDSRMLLENKPKLGIHDEICVGWSPEEFRLALAAEVFAGFVLDLGHAACAAVSVGREAVEFVREFLTFRPKIFHLSDGDFSLEKDTHYNLGQGDLPLQEFLRILPGDALLTLECPHRLSMGLTDFIQDVGFLDRIMASAREAERKMVLRLATVDDAEMLLKWRNDSETRSASHNSGEVTWEEHVHWLKDSLKSQNRLIYIAEIDNAPIGTVRLDFSGGAWELSWTVAPEARGRGWGKMMVSEAAKRVEGAVRAEIKQDNKASQSIALSAGMSFAFELNDITHWFRGPK